LTQVFPQRRQTFARLVIPYDPNFTQEAQHPCRIRLTHSRWRPPRCRIQASRFPLLFEYISTDSDLNLIGWRAGRGHNGGDSSWALATMEEGEDRQAVQDVGLQE